ncbi:MAG: type IV secretion system DNA-binding domain-containing protein [Bacillota bacterium]|nr:type IV secretion system DNA-binding domain-containing protein [Bacillota bacterium]
MENITRIGKTNFRNTNQVFGIKEKDRAGHIYCIGKTGVGKSTLLLNMAIDDIYSGKGVGIIDPHGDLSENILDYVPRERIKDVVYFNACDTNYPIAFNPLYKINTEERHLVASNIVSTLKRIWAESWGPRLEHILRNTILTLVHYPHATLLDIQPLLIDFDFRKKVLQFVTDTHLLDFWYKEFNAMSPQFKSEAISPIINKVGLFQTHAHLRNIVGQEISSFSIADVMNHKKIFIANLSKGHLGEDATTLLGSMLITQFQTAALQRSREPIHTRIPFYLYIDEMHSFITLSFADILSESRKYGLSLFLTHQYIDQLHPDIRKAILGNVGTIISFRIGANDADLLKPEFNSLFDVEDFIRLPQYAIYLKLLIDGTTSESFSAYTLPITKEKQLTKTEVIKYSRKTYAVEKGIVEQAIYERYEARKQKNTEATLFEN